MHERKDISDPLIFDPAEELTRQDLAVLLDRAMSYLPAGTRQALELCYLVELPPNEAAARLGLTLNALEVRLHRARRQLRQVLNGELRANAESFGLALDKDATTSGDFVLITALPFYMYQLTGSVSAPGAMFIVQALPSLLFGSV